MTSEPRSRWEQLAGRKTGDAYAEHFSRLADSGQDVHGEATFCAGLVSPPARVLDAGCGTGRVAIRLAELRYDTVGVDLDTTMLDVARKHAPGLTWLHGDLAALPEDVRTRTPYDLVVLAGNVVPLLAPGALADTLVGLADLLAPDGLLVTGFGLDRAHLPPGCPVTPLEEYDGRADAAGLTRTHRFGTWDAEPFDPTGGYAVNVHART
jgi:SAM-dependent methyltransferase